MQLKELSIEAEFDHGLSAALHTEAIERVILTMRERLQDPLSIEDLADVAYLSPYHFSRVFHRQVGVAPGEFLAALRLYAAKQLLLTTSLSVTDICFEVGYNSLGSFTTRFTRLVGLPPRHLRQQAETFTPPVQEAPEDGSSRYCQIPQRGCIIGHVSAPETFTGAICVGLFPKPLPQGRPVRCTRLFAPGQFLLTDVPDGCYYLLSAAFPSSIDTDVGLRSHDGLFVGMCEGPVFMQKGKAWGQADIVLRVPRVTDPPLVIGLPFL